MKHHCWKKKNFYSKPNLQDITDSDYMHAERVWKKFEIKHLSEYHDLHIESDILKVELEVEYVTLLIDMQQLIIKI